MSAARAPRLAAAWLTTMSALGGHGDLAGTGARLLAAYAARHRAYHNLTHLDEVLGHVGDLAAYALAPDVVRVAAWCHDVVYESRRADNEERSASWAERELAALGLPPEVVGAVARLVRLTAHHDPAPDDRDGLVLCDADLAILAAPPERYGAYTAGVRREYGHLDDDAFRAGRAGVLRALLDRAWLYGTPSARRRWEAPARANLVAELTGLP